MTLAISVHSPTRHTRTVPVPSARLPPETITVLCPSFPDNAIACTCPGEDHPGPNNGVGRAAPEIDLIEAQIIIDLGIGEVSQSNQIAPYDAFYQYNNASIYCDIEDLGISKFNSYKGGIYQEAVSVLTQVPSRIYRDQVIGGRKGEFATFELEWLADFNNRKNGFITWAVDGKRAWTMRPGALAGSLPRSRCT
jgi:hypothetical protein